MKLCWDNIENIRLTENGNFRDVVEERTYYLKVCKACGEEFLGEKDTKCCCYSCANSGKNHPMYGKTGENNPMYGKKHSDETKEKLSRANKGVNNPNYGKTGKDNPMYGKTGKNSHNWKGGYGAKGIPTYDTYAPQLDWCEDVRRSPDDKNVLEVRCTYCGKWYVPSQSSVKNRIGVLEGRFEGECRLYCSDSCKKACPIYGQKPEDLMKQDAVRAGRLQWLELNREVQPELRKMVLERDEYTCQKCGTVDKSLHCHHILPVTTNPIESADVDNCITYCIDCHKQAHDQDGCKYSDLQTEICF